MEDDFASFKNKCIVVMTVAVIFTTILNVGINTFTMIQVARIDSMLTSITATQELNSYKTKTILERLLKK